MSHIASCIYILYGWVKLYTYILYNRDLSYSAVHLDVKDSRHEYHNLKLLKSNLFCLSIFHYIRTL